MRLTRTPWPGRKHDYNLNLTTQELLTLAKGDFHDDDTSDLVDLIDRMFKLFEGEADRIGSGE